MRDCCKNEQNCGDEAFFKKAVIIGNGPSGIVLSYILSGNWPYYNGATHPDEMLLIRLRSTFYTKSLIEQDLQFLSLGLEGRSRNPVAVLIDALNHPYDDQNLNNSSGSLLEWRRHPEKIVDHVVIGKGKPGGVWQELDGNLTTISVSSWMELPGLSFNEWENSAGEALQCACKDKRPPRRVKIKQVEKYYRDYVERMKITKNFRNFSYVTSVKPLRNVDQYTQILPDDISEEDQLWEIEGYDKVKKKNFTYVCRNVVLAVGVSDSHNTLNVPGELTNSDWVFHDVKQFESAVVELKKNHAHADPVLIVGSGLTAADAVMICDQFNIRTLHIFNSCTMLADNKLPKNMYPEYHRVYKMMKGEQRSDFYETLQKYTILDVSRSTKGKRVKLVSPDGLVSSHQVSLIAIMVGYRPVLDFLAPEFDSGKKLGMDDKQPIHSRKNPIKIAPWSYKVVNSPDGLYAMGPLVGDNIVRVIPGGAVAIASHLCKRIAR